MLTKSMESIERWNRRLTFVVFVCAIACFAVASLLPVYTDEITWSAILGRLNYDHGRSLTITLQPTCEGFYAHSVAPVMWWPRFVSTLLVEQLRTPLSIRLWGVVQACAWLAILSWLLVRLFPNHRLVTFSFAVSWLTLGVMPCLLVLNRPEQILLIGTTVFLILGLKPFVRTQSAWKEIMRACSIFAGIWYVLAAHPRGLFIAPAAMIFSYRVIPSKALRWGVMPAVALMTWLMMRAWEPLWSCSHDPGFARLLAFGNYGNARSTGLSHAFWTAQLHFLSGTRGWYLRSFVPQGDYASNIVPPFAMRHVRALRDPMEVICLLVLVLGVVCFVAAVRTVVTSRRDISLVLLVLSGWIIYVANVLVRVEKNAYEAAYMQPLIGLLIMSSVWVCFRVGGDRSSADAMYRCILPTLQSILLLLSLTSQVFFLQVYGELALTSWKTAGQPVNQRFSVGLLHYDEVATRVLGTAKQCSIDPRLPQYHLVLDESSYFVFRQSSEPLFVAYFDDRGWGYYRPDPTDVLHSLRSSGMIAYCNRIPTLYLPRAKRQGDMCCLPSF